MPDARRFPDDTPPEGQFAAMAALLRDVGPESPLAGTLLRQFVRGVGTAKAVERLRQLEGHVGKSHAIDVLCAALEERLRMTCPRCGVQLRKPEMEQHLLGQHRLLLDGRRVRDAWAVVEEWAASCGGHPILEVMDRCRDLARRLDPDQGTQRLGRLFLRHGIADDATRRGLLADARARQASLCPSCYAPVPAPPNVPALEVRPRGGRLWAHGYCIDVSDRGLLSRLEVRTPDALLYRGREPGRVWTARGARLVFAGPCVLLALLTAAVAPTGGGLAFLLTAGLLLAAGGAAWFVHREWREPADADRRVLDYAWRFLAPGLHADGFDAEDAAFAAGLARQTLAAGPPAARPPLLQELAQRTEAAVREGQGTPAHLAALRRLLVADAVADGADPVRLLLAQLARCFDGKLPLAYADELLRGWESDWWTAGNQARLRVLLCDRAFEAGFEVHDLLDAGRHAPSLGTLLQTDAPAYLAALRLLWSLRPTRPWDKCGATSMVFELANDAENAALLAEHPDLLLFQEEAEWETVGDGGRGVMGPARILLCAGGVVLQEVLFTAPPRSSEVIKKTLGYEMVLGRERFRSRADLDGLAQRMERWFRYWFNDFLAQTPNVLAWRAPDRAAILRAWGAVPCPECERPLLPRRGEVGVAADDGR